MQITKVAVLALGLLTMAACTENNRTKNWGGEMKVDLQCGQKLFDLTWKNDTFWYATRPMRKDETPETYTFHAKSGFGIQEGTVRVKECRNAKTR